MSFNPESISILHPGEAGPEEWGAGASEQLRARRQHQGAPARHRPHGRPALQEEALAGQADVEDGDVPRRPPAEERRGGEAELRDQPR